MPRPGRDRVALLRSAPAVSYSRAVPRIRAATVAEHRAHQRAELLRAAVDVVASCGAAGLTLAAVGERVGLARSSVYKYFTSVDDLVLAAVEEIFDRWRREVAEATAAVDDPLDRVAAFVRRTLSLVAEGEHRLVVIAASVPLTAERRRAIGEHHRAFMAPLSDALAALEAPDPGMSATLLYGVVDAAVRRIEAGAPVAPVTELAVSLVVTGARSLSAAGGIRPHIG